MSALLYRGVVAAVIIFLMLPILFVIFSSFGESSLMVFPPTAFSLKWYKTIPPEFVESLKVSLIVACLTALVAAAAGTGTALAIARGRFPGIKALATFNLAPLMVPSLVIAVALFQFAGLFWDLTGIDLVGTLAGLVIGHSACAAPYVVRAVLAGHSHFDYSLEEAAMSLGASKWRTMTLITLPVLLPGIAAGALFAFLISWDDLPIALFMAGGESTTTFPVKVYASIEYSLQPDVMAVSAVIIYASLALVILLDRAVGVERLLGGGKA
jgi:putative spermidine/putrescine transport system permease protein